MSDNLILAQTCLHKNLSNTYNYRTTAKKIKDEFDVLRMNEIIIEVLNKSGGSLRQKIIINNRESNYILDNVFSACNLTRSYITGINKNKVAEDGDYGDFIVADLNFDEKEDIVGKMEQGSNSGPSYQFLTMRKDGNFKNDTFLSESVQHFSDNINYKTKTLTTFIQAGAYGYNEHVFKYNPITEKWVEIKKQYHKG